MEHLKYIEEILSKELSTQTKLELLKTVGCNYWTEYYLDKFKSQDTTIAEIKNKIRTLQGLSDPVLIMGPSGTGKQLLAQALHGAECINKYDNAKPFVHLNCAGLPDSLFESELFGHVKGAFTGALQDKKGLLVHAKEGTLFLDEIGEMPLMSQAKLLTVLQERLVRPVGGTFDIPIQCRVVCATQHNLQCLVDSQKFREDLYNRLSTFEITIPSLGERGEAEINFIIKAMCPDFPPIQYDDLDISGNVRSLQKMVRRWQVFKSIS